VTCCARAGMVVPSVAVSLRAVWTSVVALRSSVSVVAGGGGARQSPERSAAGGHATSQELVTLRSYSFKCDNSVRDKSQIHSSGEIWGLAVAMMRHALRDAIGWRGATCRMWRLELLHTQDNR